MCNLPRITMACLIVSLVGFTVFGDDPAKPAENKAPATPAATAQKPESVLAFTVNDIDGQPVKLEEKYRGKVLLLVNSASKCGYTPQYADLESIYTKYHDKGFEILAFPSNDFASQEPGTESEIKQFCSTKYNVTFPLFSKIPVKGPNRNPLYVFLTDPQTNPSSPGEIRWNFTKFLIGRDGKIIARFEPAVKPTDERVAQAIESALETKSEQKKS